MTLIRGVDGVDHTLTGATLRSKGYAFMLRYLSPESWKNLTLAEAREKTAHGIRIISNWEASAHPTDSYAAGRSHALAAAKQHAECGGPSWAPIYFSVDSDVNPSSYKNYFRGVNSALGVARTGCYGEQALIHDLHSSGLLGTNDAGVPYGLRSQSASFPGGRSTVDVAIYQDWPGGRVAGHSVDFDYALTTDYGGWLIGEADPSVSAVDVWNEDIIPNPKGRPDSPGHTPPGTNVSTQAKYALSDCWERVIELQNAVAELTTLVKALVPPAPQS